jgi:sister chromatid cohesion protein PDS5
MNTSSIPTLVKHIQQQDEFTDNARRLLVYISKNCPLLYSPHGAELAKALANDRQPELVETALQALATLARADPEKAPSDKRILDRVARLAVCTNPKHSKFAARFLTYAKGGEQSCEDVVNVRRATQAHTQGFCHICFY